MDVWVSLGLILGCFRTYGGGTGCDACLDPSVLRYAALLFWWWLDWSCDFCDLIDDETYPLWWLTWLLVDSDVHFMAVVDWIILILILLFDGWWLVLWIHDDVCLGILCSGLMRVRKEVTQLYCDWSCSSALWWLIHSIVWCDWFACDLMILGFDVLMIISCMPDFDSVFWWFFCALTFVWPWCLNYWFAELLCGRTVYHIFDWPDEIVIMMWLWCLLWR